MRSDEDAGLRQGMLSMSSKVAAAGNQGGVATGAAQADLAAAVREAALGQRSGSKGMEGSTARGSMVRTYDPTKVQVTCCQECSIAADTLPQPPVTCTYTGSRETRAVMSDFQAKVSPASPRGITRACARPMAALEAPCERLSCMQTGGVAGVATTGDDNLADASLRDVRPPQKTLSQVRHTMHRAAADKKQAEGKLMSPFHRGRLNA